MPPRLIRSCYQAEACYHWPTACPKLRTRFFFLSAISFARHHEAEPSGSVVRSSSGWIDRCSKEKRARPKPVPATIVSASPGWLFLVIAVPTKAHLRFEG